MPKNIKSGNSLTNEHGWMKVCMPLKYYMHRNVGSICDGTEPTRLVHPPRWRIATGFPWQDGRQCKDSITQQIQFKTQLYNSQFIYIPYT